VSGPASNPWCRLARKLRSRTRSWRVFAGLATMAPQSAPLDETIADLAVGVVRSLLKKEIAFQGLCARMFSCMATTTERQEILERVRSIDGMMNGEPASRATADAAVSVPEPRRPSQPLPGEAVELAARGTRALGTTAGVALARRAGEKKHSAARASTGERHLPRPSSFSIPRANALQIPRARAGSGKRSPNR
jgi:Trp operon repressor